MATTKVTTPIEVPESGKLSRIKPVSEDIVFFRLPIGVATLTISADSYGGYEVNASGGDYVVVNNDRVGRGDDEADIEVYPTWSDLTAEYKVAE